MPSAPGSSQIKKSTTLLRGGLGVGFGSVMKKIVMGTVTLSPAAVGAAQVGLTAATITGVAAGDIVILWPPVGGAGPANLIVGQAYVSAANTVQLPIGNPTAGSITPTASAVWNYMWIDMT